MNKKVYQIKSIYMIFMIVTVLIFSGLLFVAYWNRSEFVAIKTATHQYIVCTDAAKDLKDGSDYLTEQVRLYVFTGQSKYMENYFEEVNVTKRRDNAVLALAAQFPKEQTLAYLQEALVESNQLMLTEIEAMKLTTLANGYSLEDAPKEVREFSLDISKSELPADEMRDLAREMVFSDTYQLQREEIMSRVSQCMDNLQKETNNSQNRAILIFTDTYIKLLVGVVLLIFIIFIGCLFVRMLILVPLKKCEEMIKTGNPMEIKGAEELQKVQQSYNRVYKENKEALKLIRHDAEYDALTDVFNRRYFDKLLSIYESESTDKDYALMIIDVDQFKEVNDQYGHHVGDDLLKKVASVLKNSFRSIDHVCRIGGDEFAIIMVNVKTETAKSIIAHNVDRMNEALTHPTDGLPEVSLSVGAAFSDRKNPTNSIFNDADTALYRVKTSGRKGCMFYSDCESS